MGKIQCDQLKLGRNLHVQNAKCLTSAKMFARAKTDTAEIFEPNATAILLNSCLRKVTNCDSTWATWAIVLKKAAIIVAAIALFKKWQT